MMFSLREKVRSGNLSLSSQYICNWLVRWKYAPGTFLPEVLGAIHYYPVWRRSFVNDPAPLEQTIPWLGGNVIAFLKANIRRTHRVFEWGSGSSTLFLARLAGHVESVEHDEVWFKRVQQSLQAQQLTNVHCECVLPEASAKRLLADDPQAFTSHKPQWQGYQFERYVKYIERFPDASFDWILIDGRARPSCLIAAMTMLKPAGWLMLDNAARSHYQLTLSYFAEWHNKRLIGPVCLSRNFVETLFIQKPKDDLKLASMVERFGKDVDRG